MLSCFVLNVSVNEVYRSGVGVWEENGGGRYVLSGTLGPASFSSSSSTRGEIGLFHGRCPKHHAMRFSITVRS